MTEYHLPKNEDDLARVIKFFRGAGLADQAVRPPIIYAERDGDVIGAISTRDMDDVITPGHWYSPERFVSMRLIEYYENLLRNIGVTVYYVSIDADNEKLKHLIEQGLGVSDPREHENVLWYRRGL
jgi:hypothetical protein